MGVAKCRAERRREAREAGEPEPQYAPHAPQLVHIDVLLPKVIVESIEKRRELTDFESRSKFVEQLLHAGIARFDMELNAIRETQAEKAKPLVELATSPPANLKPRLVRPGGVRAEG